MDPYSGGDGASTVRHRSLSRQSQVELVSGQTAAASQLEQLLLASPDPPSMPAGLNPTAPLPAVLLTIGLEGRATGDRSSEKLIFLYKKCRFNVPA